MTEVKHYCDHCSEQIHESRTLLKVQCGPERVKRQEIDLCVDCLREFTAWLDARPNGCTAPTPRPNKAARLAGAAS